MGIAKGDVNKFVGYCQDNLDLSVKHYATPYGSLGPCVLDCIYSLRTKYFKVTVPVVERYGNAFMGGKVHDTSYSLSDFISHIKSSGGTRKFAENVLNNKQVLSGRLKSEICLELAEKLVEKGIETKKDFASFNQTALEQIIRQVKGVGDAAVNYMFMLAGDQNRCKPDVHIHHCIKDAIGRDVSNSDCQILFTEAVKILKKYYPRITVALLDGFVWEKYRV
ncbi:MAG: hypothetical protein J6Y43_08445 [Clostridia bacterium]|nr:hypothetical protein [Clostridia bacterium]